MIKAVIFDFDGVIIESVDIKTKAFAKLFQNETPEAIERIVSYHLENTGVSRFDKFMHIYKEILNRKFAEGEFDNLCERFSKLVMNEVISAPFVSGAQEFIKNYSLRYRYFVITATPQEEIEEILCKRGIANLFVSVYGAPRKKDDAVKDILVKEKCHSDQIVYIGDSLSDYLAAKKHGVNFIARIYNKESLFSCFECPKVFDLSGVAKALEKL